MARVRRRCPKCGDEILRGPGQHAYCSDACRPVCAFSGCELPRRGNGELCDNHRMQIARTGELKPARYIREWVCAICGADVPKGSGRRRHCSAACNRAGTRTFRQGRRPKSYNCALCGETVSLIDRNRKNGKLQRSDSSMCPDCKVQRHNSRSPVSIRQLVRRDGPNCGICNLPVDTNLKRPNPMSPSVDHVIPRALGGLDEPGNCQLAHLRCNISKGARPTEMTRCG